MFTGLVQTTGRVLSAAGDSPRRLTIASSIPHAQVVLGESVAIDGCCLTVVEIGTQGLTFEAATETLSRTTLGKLSAGDEVNLERALAVGDRLGGHIVTGHVDCVGRVRQRQQRGSAPYFSVEVTEEVARLTAPRGSIALAGVSLTVTDIRDRVFSVAVIPHTLDATNLRDLSVGDEVNVEADLLARYVQRLVQARPKGDSLTEEFLKDKGFL